MKVLPKGIGMKAVALFSLMALPLLASSIHASERATVCAKYAVNYGWSSGYKVEATIAHGSELNQSTIRSTTTDYQPTL